MLPSARIRQILKENYAYTDKISMQLLAELITAILDYLDEIHENKTYSCPKCFNMVDELLPDTKNTLATSLGNNSKAESYPYCCKKCLRKSS